VPITCNLEDMPRVDLDNNSTLMESQEPLDHNNGRTMLWKFNQMEVVQTLDSLTQSTQDGGNFSERMVLTSPLIKVKSCM
jgi:hypothetical protein